MQINPRAAVMLSCVACLLGSGVAGRTDEKGDALRTQIRTAEKSAKTLSADYSVEIVTGKTKTSETGTLSMKKPLMVKMEQKGAAKGGLYSDGKHYSITAMGKQLAHGDANLASLEGQPAPVLLFFGPGSNIDTMLQGAKTLRNAGTEMVAGVKCDILELTIKELDMSVRLAANPEHIVIRSEVKMKPDGETLTIQTCTLKNLKVNGDLPDASFALPH